MTSVAGRGVSCRSQTHGKFCFYGRVRRWATLNEPWCSAFLGYRTGGHAPGLRDDGQAVAAAHRLLLAHGAATAVLREALAADAQVGIALNPTLVRSASGARFGIVHVDYATQRRTPKASALWYRDVVRRNGLP
ncbi:MAG: family 1 glycosylhydrolase [Nitriliruptorales bacterium]